MPSWSSDNCSSNAEHSMPRLSTPRMVPIPSVMFLPGMKVPGGENTPFMPARAFGAPHTTCTGSPDPVSTMHTRSLSALGCGSAEITRAMVNGASALALFSTLSTSRPIMVSLCTMASSGWSVSRWSLSHERVSFMAVPRDCRGAQDRRCLVPSPACGGGSGRGSARDSRAQPSRQSRKIERPEAVVGEPAYVGLEESAQVVHAVFEHGDAIDPHAPGESLVSIGVDAAVSQHVRMHHAAAKNFEPVVALAEADLALVAAALDVDFEGGLGKREERRPEPHFHVLDLEKCLAELGKNPLQVTEMRGLVDDQALDLMKHRCVRLVAVAPIGAARADHADRRPLGQHGAHLHR